jgi:hypothetical protein
MSPSRPLCLNRCSHLSRPCCPTLEDYRPHLRRLYIGLRLRLLIPASTTLWHLPFQLHHLCQFIFLHVHFKLYVVTVFEIAKISATDNVRVAIKSEEERTTSAGSIYIPKTSQHSNAEMSIPSQRGMVVIV